MAASRTGVVGVPSDVDMTCVLSFTFAFATQRRWVMIKTNFQPKIGLKQPNALTQRSQPSIWVEKTTQRFLECIFTILRQLAGSPLVVVPLPGSLYTCPYTYSWQQQSWTFLGVPSCDAPCAQEDLDPAVCYFKTVRL